MRHVTVRHRDAQDALNRTVEWLREEDIAPETLLLGGGTALDAWFAHRESRDIDLDIDRVRYETAFGDERRRQKAERFLERGAQNIRVQESMLSFYVPARTRARKNEHVDPVHASVVAKDKLAEHMSLGLLKSTMAREPRTGIAVAPPWYILRGKLQGRILCSRQLLERDLHDLVVSTRLDPENFLRACAEVQPWEWRQLAARMRRNRTPDEKPEGSEREIKNAQFPELVGSRLRDEWTTLCLSGPDAYVARHAPSTAEPERTTSRGRHGHATRTTETAPPPRPRRRDRARD